VLAFEGVHESAEGAYLGAAAREQGPGTLDYLFRLLLQQLTLFRAVVDPDIRWAGVEGEPVGIVPLTAVTHEKDPGKRAAILKRYNDEMLAELARKR
jgi:hypothetical protein